MKAMVFSSRAGCLLPALIFFNLFFGWLFFPPHIWLAAEGVMILLFVLNSYILMKNVSRMSRQPQAPARRDAIDVEARIVDDKK